MGCVDISKDRIEAIRDGHHVLAEFEYGPTQVIGGYAGQTLYVNVGENRVETKPVDQRMKDTFIGGRGFDLWLLWNAVTRENRIRGARHR